MAEVRAQLEKLAVRRLAERATDDDVRSLTGLARACEEQTEKGHRAQAFEADSAFHLELASRSGNPFLHEMLQRFDAYVMLYRLTFCLTMESLAKNVKRHREIVDAIARRDAHAAETIMAQHALSMGRG